ncbi:MAG: hypothetical protein GF311_05835 [Candidatus Lokiarchaeota archaeon]|nr:hypothetical protein [Candidatus Lokiarchaeota archaeon]
MGENLYGKFGFDVAIISLFLLVITMFIAFTFGVFIPDIVIMLLAFLFITDIIAIVLGILGIIRDDLKEKAIRTLIAAVVFLIGAICIVIVYNWFRTQLG